MEKMVINSKVGTIEVDPKTVIHFPKGILGFPELKDYVILDPDEQSPLKILQCTEIEHLAFIITNHLIFKPDYKIRLFEQDMEEVKDE